MVVALPDGNKAGHGFRCQPRRLAHPAPERLIPHRVGRRSDLDGGAVPRADPRQA
jgi:hypothetical protein